jgi:GNAT superfamily N-acetyltransferase
MEAVITSMEENFSLHSCRIPGLTAGMKVFSNPNLTYVDSGIAADVFNVVHIRKGKGLTADQLKKVDAHYRKKGLPYCIWINEQQFSGAIEEIFRGMGLRHISIEPGMVLDLDNWRPIKDERHANIKIAATKQELKDFAAILSHLWKPYNPELVTYYERVADKMLDEKGKLFIAVYYLNGEPLSGVEVFPTNDAVAGIYNLVTLERHRGKGIGRAMMSFALNKARDLNFKTIMLQASEDGRRIYEQLGFRAVTKYYEYQH